MTDKNRASFPKGFQLTRTHIDASDNESLHSATSVENGWLYEEEGKVYPTLDTLNFSIDGKLGMKSIQEVWKYVGEDGKVRGIETLDKELWDMKGRGALF